jgi:membrane protease YdiL (CAAX protease family)
MAGTDPSRRRSTVEQFVRDNQTATFAGLTLTISWGLWIPLFIAFDPATVTEAHVIPGAFGPFAAAALVTWLSGASVRDWLRSVAAWRASPRWYLAALAVPIAIGVAVGVVLLTDTGTIGGRMLGQLAAFYPVMVLVALLVGGGQEEPGWRGFALPRLQERFDALTASLLIGIVWALWHLPLFAFEAGIYSDRSYLLYVPAVLAFSVLLTWLYNSSGGTVAVAALFHAGVNSAPNLPVPLVGGEAALTLPFVGVVAAVGWTAALAVVFYHGRATLVDGPAVTPRSSEIQARPSKASERKREIDA